MANNRRLNATITIGGAVSGSLKSALGNTKQSLSQVGDAIKHVHDRQKELNRVIAEESKLGSSASALKVDYARREIGDLDERLDRLREINEALRENQAAQEENLANREELRNSALDMVALGAAIAVPINAAMKFETAMLGVAKQVEGARDPSGKLTTVYYDMTKQIQALGRESTLSTNELAEMATAGARMGVARQDLIAFTKTSMMMAEALELPAGQLADDMGKIAGLYKIPIPAISSLADSINYLDDNAISKGGDIIDFLTRVGGVASSIKITGKETVALGSTLLTLGDTAETASTAANAILQKLAAAEKGTKAFQGAMDELGLSSKKVQKGMIQNAPETLLKVLDKISKLPKDKQSGVMIDLVGLEHSDTLAKLANNTAEFRKQMEMANSEKAKGGIEREFQARLATTEAQLKILGNNLNEVAVNIGSVLLPAINATIGVMAPFINIVADFARENPGVTQAIVGTAVALGGLRVAVWGVSYAYTFVKGAALSAVGLFYRTAAAAEAAGAASGAAAAGPTRLGLAFLRVGTAIRAVGVAFMTTGIGAIIAGIAAGAYVIYQHWDGVSAFFKGVFAGISEGLAPLKPVFDGFIEIMKPLKPVFDFIGESVKVVWRLFTDLIGPVEFTSEELKAAGEAGKVFGRVLAAGIKLVLSPLTLLIKGITWVKNNFGGVRDKGIAFGSHAGSMVGDAIDSVFKTGAAVSSGGKSSGSSPSLRLPSVPVPAGHPRASYNDNSQTTIHVTQQPGQSTRQLAEEITRIQEQQKGIRQRGRLTDFVGAQ